jgi:hypothetical protein
MSLMEVNYERVWGGFWLTTAFGGDILILIRLSKVSPTL